MRFEKSSIPITQANDSCHPGSKMQVGRIRIRTTADKASVLKGLGRLEKSCDRQNTIPITAALKVAERRGTTIQKSRITNRHIAALDFSKSPVRLQINHTDIIKIPICRPLRLIK
jgi:hypothetical protein